jgi:hypothetical protein
MKLYKSHKIVQVQQHRNEKMELVQQTVYFFAVPKDTAYPEDGTDEDNSFARWTPQASCEITIANPNLWGKLVEGQRYYVDFTLAPPNKSDA